MYKILILDVDGTLTDGKIYMGSQGEMFKVFDIKDGCGIHDLLIPNGILPVIITGRMSVIVETRCKEIGIKDIYQGVKNKHDKLIEILHTYNLKLKNVVYVGDDINDLECMQIVKKEGGKVACPADAVAEVIEIADLISRKNGGNGAVREVCEWMVSLNN